MVLCEKPLGDERRRRRGDGRRRSRAAGVPNMVWYNYRRVPGRHAGQAAHRRGQARPHLPLPREVPAGLDDLEGPAAGRRRASGGSTSASPAAASPATCWPTASTRRSGSTARSTDVTAMTETFIKERKHNLTGKVEPVGIDDACAFLCRFENGSLATFESTRYARGHKALYTFEINGEHASVVLGPARPAPPAVLRPPRRRPASAAGAASTSPTAIIRT